MGSTSRLILMGVGLGVVLGLLLYVLLDSRQSHTTQPSAPTPTEATSPAQAQVQEQRAERELERFRQALQSSANDDQQLPPWIQSGQSAERPESLTGLLERDRRHNERLQGLRAVQSRVAEIGRDPNNIDLDELESAMNELARYTGQDRSAEIARVRDTVRMARQAQSLSEELQQVIEANPEPSAEQINPYIDRLQALQRQMQQQLDMPSAVDQDGVAH